MEWNENLKEATYTSPSGKVFKFGYDSGLESETDLKTVTFTFPEKDGALVVPLGVGGRRFSFTCFFYGKNCVEESASFEEGLKERGYGSLQHPLYGTHKVVPTGTIKRSDNLVSGVAVSSVDVTFAQTLIDEAEGASVNSEVVAVDKIDATVDIFEESAAAEFAKDVQTKNVKGLIWLANTVKKGLKICAEAIATIAKGEKEIYTQFQTIYEELVSSVADIVDAVEDVAFQTVKFMRLPSAMAVDALTKVEGYGSAIESIIKVFKNDSFNVNNVKNQWASTRLMLESLMTTCASGVAISSSKADGQFKSREDAVNCAANILELFDEISDYEEKYVAKDLFVETGEGYGAMRDVVSLSAQQIINSSFALPNKKIMVVDRDRNVTDLVYELYGNLDRLDEFILDNNLNYEEIELIPAGREVAYYE